MTAHQRFLGLLAFAAATSAATFARGQDTDTCINASEKALSQRKAEKLIQERASLSICAASSCPEAVRSSCQQRLALVNQAIPSMVFFAKDGAGRDLSAIKLRIDGAVYADHLDGSAIALDPGEHEFRFETTGQQPLVKRFVMHQGEQNRRENILIGAATEPVGAAPASTARAAAADSIPQPPATADEATPRQGSTRALGLVVGGVGVASLAAGGILGGLSMAAHSSYEKDCGSHLGAGVPSDLCNADGVSGEKDAATKGMLSTIFFIGGGVLGATGAVLFFTASKGGTTTQVGVGAGSVVLTGEF
jgi:hypothetical protein